MKPRDPNNEQRGGERRGLIEVAVTDEERWAEQGIKYLVSVDPDWASFEEGKKRGFGKDDTALGHWLGQRLVDHGGLSKFEWKVAIDICEIHEKQLANQGIVKPS